jgi:hypothetical protein
MVGGFAHHPIETRQRFFSKHLFIIEIHKESPEQNLPAYSFTSVLFVFSGIIPGRQNTHGTN